MKKLANWLGLFLLLIGLWQAVVSIFTLPTYLFPPPIAVFERLLQHTDLLLSHAKVTLIEIALGLICGFILGLISALLLTLSRRVSAFLMPLLVISQAVPVFAIAPLLVLWLGYGMASKIAMAVLIIYFPVTAACYDGLRNTPQSWLQLAQTLQISPQAMLFKVRLPAALPALASGLRIAVSIAPIGAVVGEWVTIFIVTDCALLIFFH